MVFVAMFKVRSLQCLRRVSCSVCCRVGKSVAVFRVFSGKSVTVFSAVFLVESVAVFVAYIHSY